MRHVILTATFSVLLSLTAEQFGKWLMKYNMAADQAAYDAWFAAEQEKSNGYRQTN